MDLTVVAFYFFSVIAVASGLLVVLARNPVHSVLWLILAFFSAAGLMVLLGAEFIALLLVIVYVGAVMVLFLFVVMMLDVDFAALQSGFVSYLPLGALIGLILVVELGLVLGNWFFAAAAPAARIAVTPPPLELSNTHALGLLLYDRYILIFQLAGLILLVAMIGAIVLTLRHKVGIKRQDIARQVARTPQTAVDVVRVETGTGIP